MDATIKGTRFHRLSTLAEPSCGDCKRLAQYLWLNELPGLGFGLITVIYLAASLISLA